MIQMIYNDTSDRSGCHRKRAASEILMMTSSVMPCGVCISARESLEPFDKSNRKNSLNQCFL